MKSGNRISRVPECRFRVVATDIFRPGFKGTTVPKDSDTVTGAMTLARAGRQYLPEP